MRGRVKRMQESHIWVESCRSISVSILKLPESVVIQRLQVYILRISLRERAKVIL